jgi:REP element-mobilizing transposase RayT
MPNHLHGIVVIESTPVPTEQISEIIPKSLGSIIRAFKGAVTMKCRAQRFHDFEWQRNYYEHVIRDDASLARIHDYIIANPIKWRPE